MSNLCWIRKDLRLHDHAALEASLKDDETFLVFVFDSQILASLTDRADKRVSFIMHSLREIEKELQKRRSSLIILNGNPVEEIPRLVKKLKIKKLFFNRDYEPYAKTRDENVRKKLFDIGVTTFTFKDSVIFEQQEVRKHQGGIYKVFTPYKNKWLTKFEETDRKILHYHPPLKNLKKFENPENVLALDWFEKINFKSSDLLSGGSKKGLKRLRNFQELLQDYPTARNYPALSGTSLLSAYLRFGNISVRDMLRMGTADSSEGAKTWVSEIIWRDFYQMILDAHPEVTRGAHRPEFSHIKFPGGEKEFKAWKEGKTGFPIIDAAMRCLNETGFMHNRLRMIAASFLCKTLLVDWRKGEQYFAEKLLDFDLASNNGGWQWCASTGSDSQPYFRIFNPFTQSTKFDPEGIFIRKWVPELRSLNKKEIHRPPIMPNYPAPIVSYERNRRRCLALYQKT